MIDIEFLGVWVTVSALGFPERTDITSLGMWVLNWLFLGLDRLTDMIPALALDDARTAFWPWVV